MATIKTDVPIELQLDVLEIQKPNEAKLREIFAELEFKTLANKILNGSAEKAKNSTLQPDLFSSIPNNPSESSEKSHFESIKSIKHNYKLIDNQEEAKKLCDFLRTKSFVSLDTETTSTHAIDAELVGLSFSNVEHEAYYVAIPSDRKEALQYVNIFKPLYEDPAILKIGQNIKYDY